MHPLEAEVKMLWTEIQLLKDKLYNYISTHEACCRCNDPPSSSSSSEANASDGNTPPQPPQPPFELLVQRPDGITVPDGNPPTWLTTILSRMDIPSEFTGAMYSRDSTMASNLPCDAVFLYPLP
ncbi:hypothetical protein EDD15DRAFT_2192605 [Pisolithus albus]|nr:hypothetical protein EDD15DRAFT_2192605 [Pisolithus albus]